MVALSLSKSDGQTALSAMLFKGNGAIARKRASGIVYFGRNRRNAGHKDEREGMPYTQGVKGWGGERQR